MILVSNQTRNRFLQLLPGNLFMEYLELSTLSQVARSQDQDILGFINLISGSQVVGSGYIWSYQSYLRQLGRRIRIYLELSTLSQVARTQDQDILGVINLISVSQDVGSGDTWSYQPYLRQLGRRIRIYLELSTLSQVTRSQDQDILGVINLISGSQVVVSGYTWSHQPYLRQQLGRRIRIYLELSTLSQVARTKDQDILGVINLISSSQVVGSVYTWSYQPYLRWSFQPYLRQLGRRIKIYFNLI